MTLQSSIRHVSAAVHPTRKFGPLRLRSRLSVVGPSGRGRTPTTLERTDAVKTGLGNRTVDKSD